MNLEKRLRQIIAVHDYEIRSKVIILILKNCMKIKNYKLFFSENLKWNNRNND